MIFRDPRLLLAAAVLAYSTVPAFAAPDPDTSKPHLCKKPEYPQRSLENMEEGITTIAFLISAEGMVGDTAILNSSGSPDLDRATQRALSRCVFKPATLDGKAVESWMPVEYVWSVTRDPELPRAKHDSAIEADRGDLAAKFQLSMLIARSAKTDADREHADALLRDAADRGYPHAQYVLGGRYEHGTGVKADIDEAFRWYQKAAAQGHVLAIQRLREGVIPR